MKNGAAYIRVSTDDQMEYSPDSQLKKIYEYAKSHDIILSDEFIFMEDEGKSGRSTKKRPQFQRMVATAKQKPAPFEVVLVWKFSRFARNREDSIVYKSMLRKQCGVDVVSVSEDIGDDKMSVLIEAIIEAMDEYYSINLGEEVKRGMTERVSRGQFVSIAPFGYAIKDGGLIPDAEQSPVVQMIFNDFNTGTGYKALAEKLNAMGLRTNRKHLFENRTVRYILTNPVYAGKVRWSTDGRVNRRVEYGDNTVEVDGIHEAIISDDLFSQVQDKVADTAKRYRKYSRQGDGVFLLQGLVRCSRCGSTLVRTAGGLQCHKYAKGTCTESHYIGMEKINQSVMDALSGMVFSGRLVMSSPAPVSQDKSEFSRLQIAREQQKLERIKAAYEDGIDSLAEYKVKKEKLLQNIRELEQQAYEAPQKTMTVKQLLRSHAADIKELQNPLVDDSEKNRILRGFVEKIVFNRSCGELLLHLYF